MDWGNVTSLEGGAVKVPSRWLHLHYYEALNILFRVENSLRMLVYIALKNEHGQNWASVSLVTDDGEASISNVAKKRRNQAATFGYLGYPITSPLMYLTTGELIKIIEGQWALFRPYFVGGREIITMKFAEIISVRNSFAHFRPIRSDDVETIKQLSKHVLSVAENELAEMLVATHTVPTNTTESWYAKLKLLNSKHVKLSFHQSTSGKWIVIRLTYGPPISRKVSYGDTHYFETMKLQTPAILSEYSNLAAKVTFVTEFTFGIRDIKADKETCEKIIYLCFNRKTLQDNHLVVEEELTSLLSSIEEETELIKEDNLARGKLISSVQITGKVGPEDIYGLLDTLPLESGFQEDDPPEWWGEMTLYAKDVISASHIFPWMPIAIAEKQFVRVPET